MPMRGSEPMPTRTNSMSAPTFSARRESSFMKLMRVANMALAAYFVNSALFVSITSMRSRLRMKGAYSALINRMARSSSQPTTTRSGRMKSATAAPSLRNSGFEQTAKLICNPRLANSSLTAARTWSAVPTGTVLLSTMTLKSVMARPMFRAAASTYWRSASHLPPVACRQR